MVRRILASFSGGRTSAYMWRRLLDLYRGDPDVELVAVMANSSQEDPRTLKFASECNRRWNGGLVLVEAVVRPALGDKTLHRVVSFEGANQTGAVFEDVIAKYGIPNTSYPHCTRELKQRPIHDYVQQALGWEPGSYDTAIGIRADEIDRISENYVEERFIYPLADWRVRKEDVLRWWASQDFDLDLPGEHYGNCVWCWKKSERKLLTLMKDSPEAFDFPARMEALYPFAGSNKDGQPRRFFRKNWTTLDLKARARRPFAPYVDDVVHSDPELDLADGCDESCDIQIPANEYQGSLFGEIA